MSHAHPYLEREVEPISNEFRWWDIFSGSRSVSIYVCLYDGAAVGQVTRSPDPRTGYMFWEPCDLDGSFQRPEQAMRVVEENFRSIYAPDPVPPVEFATPLAQPDDGDRTITDVSS